jgi:hypothetical protein
MLNRLSARRLHPALALVLAFGLHAGLLVALGSTRSQRVGRAPREVDAAIELSLETEIVEPRRAGQGRAEATAAPAGVSSVPSSSTAKSLRARARGARARVALESAGPREGDLVSQGEAEPADEAVAALGMHPIDLGLNGGVRRAAVLGGWVEPSAPPAASDGGLAAGLAALDAQRGQSRSNAANAASYEAARRFAPPNGMGIFDILTDERGVVLSVTLASAPADEARWQRVGQELDALLKERRFRVPPGAKGLAARLRIETGELARDLAERFRTQRGAALGQAPGGAREAHDESTRARLEPGQLSPTLGITVAGGGSDQHIRVVLLSERAL